MILEIVLVTISFGVIFCMVRAVLGPSIPDRAVAIDTMTSLMVAGLVVVGVYYQASIYLDVALVYALLAFVGTLVISKYLEERGSQS